MVDSQSFLTCTHIALVRNVRPQSSGCTDCERMGDAWQQLRMCMECGYVGCDDSSKNKHAVKHYRATGHPIARSIQAGEEWAWCYVDRLWFETLIIS